MAIDWATIATVIGVGIALGSFIWRLQMETGRRMDRLEDRMSSVETGLAELRGFINGLQTRKDP